MIRYLLPLAAFCAASSVCGYAQGSYSGEPLVRRVSVAQHFVAVHGRRALVDGYSSQGLEAWVYPFQIFRDYRVSFHVGGSSTWIEGATILGRIDYAPDAVTRVYLGPGFIVRERLFVPLDRPGVIVTYSVQSREPVDIQVRAKPVLNLMWPAALGGQSVGWDSALSALVLAEPADGYTALIGSPQIVAHDEPGNPTTQEAGGAQIDLTLRPDAEGEASLFAVLNPPHAADRGALLRALIRERQKLEAAAAEHYASFLDRVIRVKTPDERVNRAIRWAEIALDQAWVCNPRLGCGFVAGYGPSRGARRPQYAWFFAGDGLIAADAALAAGDKARARDELAFILRYQDRKTGMIWHELSQSAGFIDWAGKYPYMYVHVDVTFQFIETVAQFVAETGDVAFLKEHWNAIDAAYKYCLSLIDRQTGLPRIPAGKEGADEQDQMSDDLGLSTRWVAASAGFSRLAVLTGHNALADEAMAASQKARAAIPGRYWNATESFWVSGHTAGGRPILQMRSRPGEALTMHLFTASESTHLLDELASASFQTDWGTRSIGAGSVDFDPESYAKGSVWPVGTAALARAFWSEHRPVTALGLWRALVPLDTLDSLGHIDEVLDGSTYRPQIESVPEQTWSSGGFLDATIHGLLGLQVDSLTRTIALAPHLPPEWDSLAVQHVEIGGASVSFRLNSRQGTLRLHIDNSGAAFHLAFSPELPLGAKLNHVTFNDQPVAGASQDLSQETMARVQVAVPHGVSDLAIDYSGGVLIDAPAVTPMLGDRSVGVRVIKAVLNHWQLLIDADVPTARESYLELQTGWAVSASGATVVRRSGPNCMQLVFAASPRSKEAYRPVHAVLSLHP